MEKSHEYDSPWKKQSNLWEQFCADMVPIDNRDWNDVCIEICLAFRSLRQETHAAYCELEAEMDAQSGEAE